MLLTILPFVAREAIKQGQASEYRLWTIMRAIDSGGSGRVRLNELQKLWPKSQKSLTRAIKGGDGCWWQVYQDHIYIFGECRIGTMLDTDLGVPSKLSFDKCVNIGVFKAYCFASFFWRKRYISINILKEMYGVSRYTIKSWARKSGLWIKERLGRYEVTKDTDGCPDPFGGGVFYKGGYCYFQISNAYFNPHATTRGRHRRSDKKIRHALNMHEGFCRKTYFDDMREAYKAQQKGQKYVFADTHRELYSREVWLFILPV